MRPSIAAVHPELQNIARMMPGLPLTKKSLGVFRTLIKFFIRGVKMPAGIEARNQILPGRDGNSRIRLRIYQAQNHAAKNPALLWIHGGGYIIGSPEMDNRYMLPFIQELGAVVVSVDYRLAPEFPFPAALDDCWSALLWLAEQADSLGIDPKRIAIGGESAGAGLATALAQMAHDRGEVKPAFQLLIYPMLDDRTAARADIDPQGNFVWTKTLNALGWESFLKQTPGSANAPAYSVPSRRTDLSGLPPSWIGVGSIDLFHDEDAAYAQRLKEAGVLCELMVVPGAFHGFDTIAPNTEVVKDFRRAQVEALKKYLK